MLDVLEWLLAELGLSFSRLDGSTPAAERQTLVDAFNAPDSPVFAFLLSTRAGGQGINLTGADTARMPSTAPRPARTRVLTDQLRVVARR